MVSSKERMRLDMAFQKQAENMRRQSRRLERLANAMIVATAALSEIAETEWDDVGWAVQRAQSALDEMEALAAAYQKVEAESNQNGEPTPSEENTDG